VLLFIGQMFSLEVVYWLTSNVCGQSLGKAAAAALYTESVRQSVGPVTPARSDVNRLGPMW